MTPGKIEIEQAAERISPWLHRTAVLSNSTIDKMLDARIFFKCENFQKAGAFKSRGATNAILQLTQAVSINGVATHSSGNHAAALALAAQRLNIPAYIVMPENSNKVKIEAVKNYGGQITFCTPTLAAREETLKQVVARTGAVEIHPYNDYRIITGQATAAKELIEDAVSLDIVMAPVGGGGLLSGTALACNYFGHDIQVLGAEPQGADDAIRSFRQKTLIPSIAPNTIADGLLTSLGSLTFPIIVDHVNDILPATEHSIIYAMKLIWERMKIVVEPSSAVPLAALLEHPQKAKNKRIGIILSGGNADIQHLPF